MKYYLSLDCGNGTIKTVILNQDKEIVDYVYLENNGIINSLKKSFNLLKIKPKISGVGIIGAGRNLASKIIGSDLTRTEILATAIGILNYKKDCNVGLDLGKEDSKIICLEDGILTDFSMNSICSSNVGSYLENVSYRLGININDFGEIALKSKNPSNISGKCAVFGTSNCCSLINSGAKIEDILMGVSDSLVRNYISMLGKGKNLKPPYVFVGGVSNNKAVKKSLENYLNSEVIVPKYNTIIGAIGIGILTIGSNIKKTNFKGFKLVDYNFETKIRNCEDCENNCELNEIYENSKLIGILGSRCGKQKI